MLARARVKKRARRALLSHKKFNRDRYRTLDEP
jgi:hypothetical protein